MKTAQWLLLCGFILLFLFKGLLPGFSQIGTDFANYYTSSWIAVHDHGDTYKLYDQTWFATKADQLGEPQGGIFQPFPPPTALLMIPLTLLSMGGAKIIWNIMNMLILAALVVVLGRRGKEYRLAPALILFGTGWALVNNFYLGQVYLLMLLFLALSFHFFDKRKDILAGVLAGIFIPIKYFPLCMVALFLLEKRWRAAWSALAAAAVVVVASVLVLGWELHAQFFTSVFSSHMDGQMANPFALRYQSWNSLLRALFIKDQVLNPNPFIDWAGGLFFVRLLIVMLLLSTLVVTFRRHVLSERSIGMRLALLFVVSLLLSPASASYHMLLLALPAALIWQEVRTNPFHPVHMILIGSYFLIGLIPVAALDRFSLHGGWIVLAYPRLFLLLVIFISLVWLSSDRRPQALPEAA